MTTALLIWSIAIALAGAALIHCGGRGRPRLIPVRVRAVHGRRR